MKNQFTVAVRNRWFCYAALCTLHFAAGAFAAEPWTLTTVDFKTVRTEVTAIDAAGVHVVGNAEVRVIAFEQVLQIERPSAVVSPAGHFTLQLANGDRFAGEPAGVTSEKLRWTDANFAELTVPLKDVRSVVSNAAASNALPAQPSSEDVVRLSNGDSLRGILTDINATGVVIQPTGADPATVPIDAVRAIELAAAPGASSRNGEARQFRVALLGGAVVTVPALTLANDAVGFDLLGASRRVPVASVRSIEQVNGPVVWLSSLEPTENVQTPYLGPAAPARMNLSVRGTPIVFGPRTYFRGVGVHAYSRLTWPVDPRFKTFRTQYALDGDVSYADLTVRIKLDDKVVHEATGFTAGKLAPVVSVELDGAKSITLEVDYGGNYDVQDRLNWIEPAFLTRPAP